MFGTGIYLNNRNVKTVGIDYHNFQISSYSPTYYVEFLIHCLSREFWRILIKIPATYGLESIPLRICSRKLKNLSELVMRAFVECKNLDGLRKMLEELGVLYNRATKLQADMSKKIINEYFTGNIVALEKQLLISMEIVNSLDEDELKQIDKTVDIVYCSNKTIKRLRLDVNILLEYFDGGNKISTFWLLRLFLPKAIRQALYITKDILVNGEPCSNEKALKLVRQDLTLKRGFRKLANIWDSEPPLGSSYNDAYDFFKKNILKAIDLITVIDDAEKTRLKIQGASNLLLRPFEEKCRVPLGGKKIKSPMEMDDFTEYSFQEIIHDYSDSILNMEKE